MNGRLSTVVGIALLAFSRVAAATMPVMETGCEFPEQPICCARLLEEPEQRLSEMRRAIQETLLSSDPAVSQRALSILSWLVGATDLYPYLDLIKEQASQADQRFGPWGLADSIELMHAPRRRRIELLAPAILRGEGKEPSGGNLHRYWAIYLAARGGLDEFQPAIAVYLAALEPERIRRRNEHTVAAFLELCGGAGTYVDGPRLAFRRLLEMPAKTLEERMSSDSGFHEAVLSLALDEHRALGFRSPTSPASVLIHALIARQAEFRLSQSDAHSGPAAPSYAMGEDWLAWLRRTVEDLPAMFR
jgi:hypothetical protein